MLPGPYKIDVNHMSVCELCIAVRKGRTALLKSHGSSQHKKVPRNRKSHVQPDFSALSYVFYAEKEKEDKERPEKKKQTQIPWAAVL